jgi:serine/threonine protein kinase
MGTVHRAVRDDDAFRKTVALKLVRGGRHSDYFERRFRQERQVLAGLQHPNIATVLDGGTTEDGAARDHSTTTK